jgi:hypothetical protein
MKFLSQDLQNRVAEEKAGYPKIKGCCKVAAADGFDFVWIDTCCVDKSGSTELSEAINSRWVWYKKSEVCFAYLADVPSTAGNFVDIFSNSRWFTRGWTLQELISPSSVVFYSMVWQELGTESSLRGIIINITGIEAGPLSGGDWGVASVAQKMFWASKRETSRVEDQAYCLMGIFDVNLPMLYGEGNHAFIRLQEEIIRNFEDHSIFTWTLDGADISAGSILAPGPQAFSKSRHLIKCQFRKKQSQLAAAELRVSPVLPPSVTSRGTNLHLPTKLQDRSSDRMGT